MSFPKKRLAAPLLSTGMSFSLNNIKTWAGVDAVSGDFGSVGYGAFINASGSQIEFFTFDPSTITSALITILARGLDYHGGTTDGVATKYDWNANETIVLLGTNPPALYSNFLDKTQNQTVNGIITYTQSPVSSDTNPPTSSNFITKAYADALVLGTLTTINVIVPGTAGATIAAGNLIYFDDATNKWKLCDADTASTVENVLLGIAQGSGTDTNSISGGVLLQGVDTHQTGLTDGQTMYASNTAGGISNSAGTTSVVVGISKGTTQLYFAPRFNQQITQGQKDALAGTSGTPSSTNKYVTNDDTSTTGESGKVVRASGTSLPALDGSLLTGVVGSVILTAGQNIAQNDAVAIGDATNVKTGSNVSGATGDSTISNTTWFSQKITTTVSAVAIKQIGIKMSGNGSGGTLTVSLRADDGSGKPTGSDLGVGTVSYSTTEATYVVTFSSSIAVSPSTFYHIIARLDVGGAGRFITRDNTAGTGTNKSTDSGSTWSANNGPLVYDVYEEDTALNKIYKACSLFNSGRANGFIGFAKAAITSGNTGTVVVSGVVANTGLTSGATYYLSDTPGAVSASAGTVSRKIGKALSTTSILIKHDNP